MYSYKYYILSVRVCVASTPTSQTSNILFFLFLFVLQNNHNGFKLKDMIIENGIVAKAMTYLEQQTPQKPFRYER